MNKWLWWSADIPRGNPKCSYKTPTQCRFVYN